MRETDALAGMYGVGLIKMIFARPGNNNRNDNNYEDIYYYDI
jgi:hypothetical protein